MSKLTTAILDVLSDNESHASKEVIERACAMASAKRGNAHVALHNMTEASKIKRRQLGSNDHEYRMGTVSVGFWQSYNMAMLDSLLTTVRGRHGIMVHS